MAGEFLASILLKNYKRKSIPISEELFKSTRSKWAKTLSLSSFEELWHAVVSNYSDFEKSMLEAATDDISFNTFEYNSLHDIRLLYSRKLSNLLHTCRAYIDQSPSILRQAGGIQLKTQFQTALRDKYDNHFEYRAMEALRNHSQHHGNAISVVHFYSGWDDPKKEDKKLTVTSHGSINTKPLIENKKLNSKFRTELQASGIEKLDSREFTRHYLEQLGIVHKLIRDSTQTLRVPFADHTKELLEQINIDEGEIMLISLIRRDKSDELERMNISENIYGRNEYLSLKTSTLTNLSKFGVSNHL